MTQFTDTTSYVPGVCNINPAEIAYRRKAEYIGFVSAAVLLIGLSFTSLNHVLRAIIVFVPLFIGVIGYFQVKNRFCVSYAASGQQNATAGSDKASAITDADSRAADKRKARSMNLKALGISVVVAALTILIPNI